MPRIDYTGQGRSGLRNSTMVMIVRANEILEEYSEKGYILTLRQLFYQMVSRDMIPNTSKSYNNLGTAISTGRERGLIDWDHLTDRLRELNEWQMYDSVPAAMSELAEKFRLDKWSTQPFKPEVWVEKDALSDIVRRACSRLQVPYLVCRGYASASAMWQAGRRMIGYRQSDQTPIIFHLGDHDPSGLQMTEDNYTRVNLFGSPIEEAENDYRAKCKVVRLALNKEQIDEYEPPPNPAKETDSRWGWYNETTGLTDSWELDALEPAVIEQIITDAVLKIRDEPKWKAMQEKENKARELLTNCSDNWGEVREFLEDLNK
jgi:hypothetical protein